MLLIVNNVVNNFAMLLHGRAIRARRDAVGEVIFDSERPVQLAERLISDPLYMCGFLAFWPS